MDAANVLDELSTLLTGLSDAPYSLELHAQHIKLASKPIPALAGQFSSAVELLLSFHPATDQVWLPFLREKIKSLGIPDDFDTSDELSSLDLSNISADALSGILALFKKAENDYFSIPVLELKIKLLTFLHASYATSPSSSDFERLLAEHNVRKCVSDAADKSATHLTKGHILWNLQVAWELSCLRERKPDTEAWEIQRQYINSLHIIRLGQIHSAHEQTLQSFSSFITEYYQPGEYEEQLVMASKARGQPAKAWNKKERYELELANSPESYQQYISSEERVKSQGGALVNTLYERAVAEYASRRWSAYYDNTDEQTKVAIEDKLTTLWRDYVDAQKESFDKQAQLQIIRRAVRSVPESGEIWARYIRTLESIEDATDSEGRRTDRVDNIADVYTRALSTSLIQKHVDQILPLVLAKAGYQKRHLTDEQGFGALIGTLEDGISMVRSAAKEGDPRMTLEKYLAGVYLNLESPLTERALTLWQSTAKYYKNSYAAWSKYSELLIAENEYTRARALFKDVSARPLDWPEAIWQAWMDFEHLYGSVETIENCIEKIKGLTAKLERKRAQEATEMAAAQRAWMEASFAASAPQGTNDSVTEPVAEPVAEDIVVDEPKDSHQADKKRKADQPDGPEMSKRIRLEEKTNVKRDRENSTVFVSGLADGTSEQNLEALFKDASCGKIREIKLSVLSKSLVATIEFFDRADVPAALTKDKKRVHDKEIAVHIAWQSTLYVTNFPESIDDAAIRELFGTFGEIFDVRWPSKKYKSSRRFCYVQYTSPSAATSALPLHGRELAPGRTLTVYVSDPERKKERTDTAANAREVYVAGLSKTVTEVDLRKLFEKFGSISGVRMKVDEQGNSKGFAFIEFENEAVANASLAANNQELKKRRIAVTLADNRVQPREREGIPREGIPRERRSRTLRVKNLQQGVQEGLLQQALEKHADVHRVEIFQSKHEAIVELATTAEAGKLLLKPIMFGDRPLDLVEEDLPGSSREPAKSITMFVPRGAAGRPRAGIGARKSTPAKKKELDKNEMVPSTGKGQDDFRKMLNSTV